MLKEYIERTHTKIPFFKLLKLNLPFFALNFIFFVALPFLLRKFCIVEENLANLVKISFLFLHELLLVLTACQIYALFLTDSKSERFPIWKVKSKLDIFLSSLSFAIFKTSFFILHLFLFRCCIERGRILMFLVLFSFFFILLISLYLPQAIANNWYNDIEKGGNNKLFFERLKTSLTSAFVISFKLFTSHPFFTSFLFLHSLSFLFLSPITLFFYPSTPHILYNISIAYKIRTSCL